MRWPVLFVSTVALLGIGATAPLDTSGDTVPGDRSANAAWITQLPGDEHPFSIYDFRQDGFGGVDWPVTFIFDGKATIDKVRAGLCDGTRHAWKYCDGGGPMYFFDGTALAGGTGDLFVSDSGKKRFNENCSSLTFTAHVRLYAAKDGSAPGTAFTSEKYGNVVVGTTHLDFEDHSGCSARIHGYPDVAQAWFTEAMKTIAGWEVHPDAFDLGNGSDDYVIMRELSGNLTPHVYGNDGKATEVVIP